MPESTRGIVLSTQNYSESSLICRIYTRRFGLQSYIVKGARRKNSKINAAVMQAPGLVELVAYHKKNRGLQNLTSISNSPPFVSLPSNPEKRTLAIFLADLLYRSIKEEESNEQLFDFIDKSLQFFDRMPDSYRHFHLYFMLQLSKYLGFFPGNNISGENRYFDILEGQFTSNQSDSDLIADEALSSRINTLLENGMNAPVEISCSAEEERMLFHTFVLYYEYHHLHGQKIKSRYLIDEVLN